MPTKAKKPQAAVEPTAPQTPTDPTPAEQAQQRTKKVKELTPGETVRIACVCKQVILTATETKVEWEAPNGQIITMHYPASGDPAVVDMIPAPAVGAPLAPMILMPGQ